MSQIDLIIKDGLHYTWDYVSIVVDGVEKYRIITTDPSGLIIEDEEVINGKAFAYSDSPKSIHIQASSIQSMGANFNKRSL